MVVASSTPRVQTNPDNLTGARLIMEADEKDISPERAPFLNIQTQSMHISCYSPPSLTPWLLFFKPILNIFHLHISLFLSLCCFLYLGCSAPCFLNLGKSSSVPQIYLFPFLCILSWTALWQNQLSHLSAQFHFLPHALSKSYIFIISFHV